MSAKPLDLPIALRGIEPTDEGLILTTWVGAVLDICPRIRTPEWAWHSERQLRREYWALIEDVMRHRPELFVLAVNPEYPSQVYGWACTEPKVIHFCYVKDDFRRFGIASMLIDAKRKSKGWTVSHWTTFCDRMGRIQYRPYTWRDLIHGIRKDRDRSQEFATGSSDHSVAPDAAQRSFGHGQSPAEIPDPVASG